MKKLNHTFLDMQGTKKRIGDIKAIFQNLEYSLKLLHSALISTNNCVTILYSWGHVIIYTYPQDKVITIEIQHPTYQDIGTILTSVVQIFQPVKHNIEEVKW